MEETEDLNKSRGTR